MFPVPERPCLIGMVVGAQGLAPDEAILGRPGHARKTQAICSWLNQKYGRGNFIAWAKQDPTRTDLPVPENVAKRWPEYKSVFDRYGKEIYAVYCPTDERTGTEAALAAFLDLLFEERGYQPIASAQASYQSIRAEWFNYLMPSVESSQVADLLAGSTICDHPRPARYREDDDGNRTPSTPPTVGEGEPYNFIRIPRMKTSSAA